MSGLGVNEIFIFRIHQVGVCGIGLDAFFIHLVGVNVISIF